ncbi:MAG TPA: FtsX-like permease family protein [Planctomycetota bacterium]|jgi:lipoprotein-releasing system permease protein
MYALVLAMRHLRSRSITWVATAMIGAVVVLYLLIISVLEGQKQFWMDKLQNIMAHTTVGVGELAWGIQKPEAWADELSRLDPGIKGVTIGLESPAMAIFNNARTVGTMRGVDLDRELKYGRLKEILFPKDLSDFGRHEVSGKLLPGCIVGGAWRKSYNLSVGSQVTFLFSDDEGDPRSVAFRIIGFFEGKNPYLETAAYVDRKFLAEKIGVSGSAKTLFVWLNDPNRPDLAAFRDRVKAKMVEIVRRDYPQSSHDKSVMVDTWQDKDGGFYKQVSNENLIMRVIMCLFLLLLAFIIFLIFGRLVAEKVRDIGALRAMGATPTGIKACFLAQGLLVGTLGVAVGLLGAWLLIHYLTPIVDFLTHVAWMLFGVRISLGDMFGPEGILTRTLPMDVAAISILAILSALFGALLPARRASLLNPVECLRHE